MLKLYVSDRILFRGRLPGDRARPATGFADPDSGQTGLPTGGFTRFFYNQAHLQLGTVNREKSIVLNRQLKVKDTL